MFNVLSKPKGLDTGCSNIWLAKERLKKLFL